MTDLPGVEVGRFVEAVFGAGDEAVQAMLAGRLRARELACGEVLWRQGEAASAVVFVRSGRLLVEVVEADGEVKTAGEVGRGQAIGMVEVISGRPRVTTLTAMRATSLLVLDADDFEAVVAAAPAFVLPLMRGLATRLSAAIRGEQGFTAPETIAVLLLGQDPGLRTFVLELAAELRAHGSVHVVDAGVVDGRFRRGAARAPIGEGDGSLERWLDALDDAHDFDLYVADAEDSPWTRRCLARADRILLVADGREDPGLRPIERLASEDGPAANRAQRDLVLLLPRDSAGPRGTAAWLGARGALRHHHVRFGHPGDRARVARRLANRAVGLVLSGGAARGMVHLGVIRGLLEAGVPIDVVGGTSAGGGVAALLGLDLSVEAMTEGIVDSWLESGVFTRPRLPIVSLLDTERVRQAMEPWVEGWNMEDLWRECFVVATNLTRARAEVIDRGPVWHAVLSTSAIPGLLPPTFRGGEVLVDGGVIDNLPVGVMLQRNPGPAIASDVSDASGMVRADPVLEVSPSNSELIRELINPFDHNTRVPWIGTTLLATATCSSRLHPSLHERLLAYLRPDTSGLPALNFDDAQPMIQVGYDAVRAALDAGAFASVLGGKAR